MAKILVCGAGGFIGSHLVSRLKAEGAWVRGVDLQRPAFGPTPADDFIQGDLRESGTVAHALDGPFDEIYQLAADMGGAGYLFTGAHDANVMHNSALVNLHVLRRAHETGVGRIFFSSSACIYPTFNQEDPDHPACTEDSAYPASPDSEYGWEKLFSERLYFAFHRNHGTPVRVARLHNVFGPLGPWRGGKEKAPAAICRKVAEAPDGGEIELWGDGQQTRSFLYIEECLEGIRRLMAAPFTGPVNLGSEELVSLNELAERIMTLAGKRLRIRHVPGPVGVRGRVSDNRLIAAQLGWQPTRPLQEGLAATYAWVRQQVEQACG